MRTIPRATILDTLINTLEAERYMRGPLLVEVIAELRANERLAEAAELAGAILASVETGLLLIGGVAVGRSGAICSDGVVRALREWPDL